MKPNNQTIIEILATKLAFVITLLTAMIPNEVLAQQLYKVVIPYGTEFYNGCSPTDPNIPNEGSFATGTTVYFRVSDNDLRSFILNNQDNLLEFFSPAEYYTFDIELQSFIYSFTVNNNDCTIDSYYPVTFNDDKPQEGRDPITWYLGERTQYVKNNTIIPKEYVINPTISTGWYPMKFELEGWYTTDTYEDGTKWDFDNDKVTGVVNLYPKWIPHKYKIVAEPSEVIQLVSPTLQEEDEINKQMIKTYIVNETTHDTIRPGYDLCSEQSGNIYWHMANLNNGKSYHTNVIYSKNGEDGWVKLTSNQYICDPVEVKVIIKKFNDGTLLVDGEHYSPDKNYHNLPQITINIPKTNPVEDYPIKININWGNKYSLEEGSNSFTYTFTKDKVQKGENTISVSAPYYENENRNFRYFYQTIAKFTFNIIPYTISFGNIETGFYEDAYEGETITEPQEPHKDGYKFDGWYTEDGKKWNFEKDAVADDLTLLAKWEPIFYTVTFHNGTITNSTSVAYGSTVTQPATPTKTGYQFYRWTIGKENNDQNVWKSDNPITNNYDIYAQWTINKHSIKYIINGEIYEERRAVEYNTKIEDPHPTKEGFSFSGWSEHSENMPDEDIIITGKWQKAPHKIAPALSNISFPTDWKKFCKKQETEAILTYSLAEGSGLPTYCNIIIETIEGSQLYYAKDGAVHISELPQFPGEYTCSAVFVGDEESTTPSDTIKFTLEITAARGLILQLYKNVIFVNNSSEKFETYQWYRYGEETDEKLKNGERQYFTEPTLKGSYWALLNGKIHACYMEDQPVIVKQAEVSISTYPNPAVEGEQFTIEINNFDPDTEYSMIISNSNGNIIKQLTVTKQQTTLSLPRGFYTGALMWLGNKQSFKIIVR